MRSYHQPIDAALVPRSAGVSAFDVVELGSLLSTSGASRRSSAPRFAFELLCGIAPNLLAAVQRGRSDPLLPF